MSLSDRLQRARAEQLAEQGLLRHAIDAEPEALESIDVEAEVEIEPEPEPGEGLFSPIVIEAQPVGLHLVSLATVDLTDHDDDANARQCPTCNGHGHADMVDLVGHTVHFTCPNCSTMWQVRQPVIPETTAS